MAVDDRQRLQLHRRLEEVLGNDEADTMMAHLPPQTWDQVASKDDVHAAALLTRTELRAEMAELGEELRGEMAELRAELRGEMAELRGGLRGEMAELREELRGEMAELREELRGEMAELREELCGEMTHLGAELRVEIHQSAMTQVHWVLGFFAVWSGLMLAAMRFVV